MAAVAPGPGDVVRDVCDTSIRNYVRKVQSQKDWSNSLQAQSLRPLGVLASPLAARMRRLALFPGGLSDSSSSLRPWLAAIATRDRRRPQWQALRGSPA